MSQESAENRKLEVNFSEQGIVPTEVEHAWILMTEAIKREIVTNVDVRETARAFTSSPVSQRLSSEFFSALLEKSALLQKLNSRYEQTLTRFLKLPEIPERLFQNGLRNALVLWEGFEDKDLDLGVTNNELQLTMMRYRFARDVKMLTLIAEVVSHPPVFDADASETKTGNGIVIGGDKNFPERDILLEPANWQFRRQIKDRVYVIGVGGKNFILKERKTARHIDTIKHGHRDGLTSKQEFETGIYLQNYQTERDHVILHWEKPIGYVLFPDGFQFVIFEYLPNTISSQRTDKLRATLISALLENREELQQEYDSLYSLALKHVGEARTDPFFTGKDNRTLFERIGVSQILRGGRKISYSLEEFARVKAAYMFRVAREMRESSKEKAGYDNTDIDGCVFRLLKGATVKLEEIVMDFEYFYKEDPDQANLTAERRRAYHAANPRSPIGFMYWDSENPVTRMDNAVFIAMEEKSAKKQPATISSRRPAESQSRRG